MASICIVAGDPSGDAHAANLVEAIRRLDPSVSFAGLGGPRMQQAGVMLLDELTRAAAIGPFDAATHLRRFASARGRFAAYLKSHKPDAVVLVDFGDFNLPVIAPLAKRAGCRVLYYISPQLWAWGRFRLRWVRRYVDRMLVLFKFEKSFYEYAQVPVTWVGHPLADAAKPTLSREQAQATFGLNPWRMTVGLLPGSRARELARHLPLLLSAAARIAWQMPGVQFLLPKAPGLPANCFQPLATSHGLDIIQTEDRLPDCLSLMDAAIVASGTATLEAALMGVPMVVVYRTSLATYLAAKLVVRVPYISIVNLIVEQELVPEFIQYRARPGRIAQALVELLRDEARRMAMREQFHLIREQLGPPGAVERAARAVLEELPK